jgi:hypothetical protein
MATICGAMLNKTQADGVVRYCTCRAKFVREDGTASCGRHKFTFPSKVVGECSICLSDCSIDDCHTTACNHTFHKKCMNKWLRRGHASCPLCRAQIDIPRVRRVPRVPRVAEHQVPTTVTNYSREDTFALLNRIIAVNRDLSPEMRGRIVALLS